MFGKIAAFGKEVFSFVDDVFTSKEEKLAFKEKFQNSLQNFNLALESEITKRHKSDMQSDSWLSKNIRPLSLLYTTTMVTLFAFTDGNIGNFQISIAYVDLFQSIMMVQFTFYFGSRGMEKYNAITASKELNKEREKTKRDIQLKKVELENIKKAT